ncbi:MAG: hypothetical protein ABSC53_08205 [Bacteroidota bacterium]
MIKAEPKYIRFTEETNAIDYLRQSGYHIARTEKDSSAWKWVILCLHGALYGFAICAVRCTDYGRVTYTTKSGDQKLIRFDEALKRAQDTNWMTQTILSKPLQLTDDQRHAIRILKKIFRDNFEHFIPKGWSIEIHGFPQIAMNVLEVINFLALDTGNYVLFDQPLRHEVKSIISEAMNYLSNSQFHKEYKSLEKVAT